MTVTVLGVPTRPTMELLVFNAKAALVGCVSSGIGGVDVLDWSVGLPCLDLTLTVLAFPLMADWAGTGLTTALF